MFCYIFPLELSWHRKCEWEAELKVAGKLLISFLDFLLASAYKSHLVLLWCFLVPGVPNFSYHQNYWRATYPSVTYLTYTVPGMKMQWQKEISIILALLEFGVKMRSQNTTNINSKITINIAKEEKIWDKTVCMCWWSGRVRKYLSEEPMFKVSWGWDSIQEERLAYAVISREAKPQHV